MTGRADPRNRNPNVLASRLDVGWELIGREADPDRRRRLEAHWLAILREYEVACDDRAASGFCSEPDDRFSGGLA